MRIKQILSYGMLALPVVLLLAVVVNQDIYAASCGGVDTAIISCDEDGGDTIEESGVWGLLELAINIMLAGVGVAAVIGIVYGAILYTSAGGSPDKVKKAMEVIRNTVIGLLAFALMWSALQWLIPGGVF